MSRNVVTYLECIAKNVNCVIHNNISCVNEFSITFSKPLLGVPIPYNLGTEEVNYYDDWTANVYQWHGMFRYQPAV